MQSDDMARELWIEVLLDDRQKGWVKAASVAYAPLEVFPDKTVEEREQISRHVAGAAWAYRDELDTLPSSELQKRAGEVAQRQRLEREARERAEAEERTATMFLKWARKQYWHPKEAVALALGFDPSGNDWELSRKDGFADLSDSLERAIKTGTLKREISPAAFLAWLRRLRIAVPPGLAAAVAELTPAPPKPQAPPPAASPFEIKGYDCPPEVGVMLEAIKQFWVNADRAKPPKGDGEIIPWIRERVDSDQKAKAIDLLIRPEWARSGGNKKQSKG